MERKLKALALEAGAAAVGVAPVERLAGLKSMDACYLLPGARSIVSIMLPLDRGGVIRRYLAKEDRTGLQRHETEVYRRLFHIGAAIAALLHAEGHRAVVAQPNLDYRFKSKRAYSAVPYRLRQALVDWLAAPAGASGRLARRAAVTALGPALDRGVSWHLLPSFSHRYGAVAAGLGTLGWSGNVLHPDWGARVLFNTVVTDARLAPDPMLAEATCDGCRICTRVCQGRYIDARQRVTVTIGGRRFEHNKKAHNLRCILVCAGFSGQSEIDGWSTWSPGRLKLPARDDQLEAFWSRLVRDNLWRGNHVARVLSDLVYHTEHGFVRKTSDRFQTTCGNCQLVCWRDRAERRENYRILKDGGEVRGR